MGSPQASSGRLLPKVEFEVRQPHRDPVGFIFLVVDVDDIGGSTRLFSMSVATLEPPVCEPSQVGRAKRLLLVAYNFPPVGGAGVQRPVKWAKYLGRFGWDV